MNVSVTTYGAVGGRAVPSPPNQNAIAFQTAIDAVFNDGGGIVSVPKDAYVFNDSTLGAGDACIDLKYGVSLIGEAPNNETYGQDPYTNVPVTCSTLIFNTSSTHLQLEPGGSCHIRTNGNQNIENLVLCGNQPKPANTGTYTPNPDSCWMIGTNNIPAKNMDGSNNPDGAPGNPGYPKSNFYPGVYIKRVTILLAYKGMQLYARCWVQDCIVGAVNTAFYVPGSADAVTFIETRASPVWSDAFAGEGLMYPANIDTYMLADRGDSTNAVGFRFDRADAFSMQRCAVFSAFDAMQIYSTSQAASGTVTFGGTWQAGDGITVKIGSGSSEIDVAYTAVAGDSNLTTLAAHVAAALNANATISAATGFTVSSSGPVVTITDKYLGTIGNAIALATVLSSAGTATVNADKTGSDHLAPYLVGGLDAPGAFGNMTDCYFENVFYGLHYMNGTLDASTVQVSGAKFVVNASGSFLRVEVTAAGASVVMRGCLVYGGTTPSLLAGGYYDLDVLEYLPGVASATTTVTPPSTQPAGGFVFGNPVHGKCFVQITGGTSVTVDKNGTAIGAGRQFLTLNSGDYLNVFYTSGGPPAIVYWGIT